MAINGKIRLVSLVVYNYILPRDVGCKKDTESPGCDSLFVLDRNQYSQQDTNGAKAEFKTRKHFPISR
ncbi:MAG: hypothetical protein IKJ62_02045, partial [Alphaproteobacteria bacterium]|nr:hypothetical protein [Alphaproteobacteria bacterium]